MNLRLALRNPRHSRTIVSALWAALLPLILPSLPARAEVSEAFIDPFVDCSALDSSISPGNVEDPYVLEALGDLERCQQNWEGALSRYQEAMDIHRANPSNVAPDLAGAEVDLTLLYFKLAQVQAITDDLDGAFVSLQAALSTDPLYGYLPPFSDRQYSPLGEPVTDGGLSGNAYAGPTTAAEPIAASVYFELGYILEKIGSPFAAIEAYQDPVWRLELGMIAITKRRILGLFTQTQSHLFLFCYLKSLGSKPRALMRPIAKRLLSGTPTATPIIGTRF